MSSVVILILRVVIFLHILKMVWLLLTLDTISVTVVTASVDNMA